MPNGYPPIFIFLAIAILFHTPVAEAMIFPGILLAGYAWAGKEGPLEWV